MNKWRPLTGYAVVLLIECPAGNAHRRPGPADDGLPGALAWSAMTAAGPRGDSVRLSELMAAWSVAIDVGLAMPLETGLRVCSRACRLARRLGLDVDGQRGVYYLALLRHIGCTADNPELAGLLGDERAFRAGIGTRDVSSSRALLPYLLQLTVGCAPRCRTTRRAAAPAHPRRSHEEGGRRRL